MDSNIDIVKRANNAVENNDFEAFKALLDPKYTYSDPQIFCKNADDMIDFMEDCPFIAHGENHEFIAQGDKVVQIFEMVATQPTSFRVRMCNVLTLKDGKIISEESFFNPNEFSEEAQKVQEQARQSKKSSSMKGKKVA